MQLKAIKEFLMRIVKYLENLSIPEYTWTEQKNRRTKKNKVVRKYF